MPLEKINFNEASKSWKKRRSGFKDPKIRGRNGVLVQCVTARPIFKGQLFPVTSSPKTRIDAINGKSGHPPLFSRQCSFKINSLTISFQEAK